MPEIIKDIDQGSEDWHQLRIGSVGGSSITNVLAKGQGKSRKTLMYQLAAEILSGRKTESYTNADMDRGTLLEPEARQFYEFIYGKNVEQIALIKGDSNGYHVSPDGLVGENGGIEIKCPRLTTHIETIDTEKIDIKYIRQCQFFLWVSGREWVDFISYCPEIISKPMWKKRIIPDKKIIEQIETELPLFLSELNNLVEKIQNDS